MPRTDTEWLVGGIRDRNIIAGAVAAGISCALHVALYINLPPINLFQHVRQIEAPQERERRILRISDVFSGSEPGRRMDEHFAARNPERLAQIPELREALAAVPRETFAPRAAPADLLQGETLAMADATPDPSPTTWQPQQALIEVERKIVDDEVALIPRQYIPKVERMIGAPDIPIPIDRAPATISHQAMASVSRPTPDAIDFEPPQISGSAIEGPAGTLIADEPIEAVSREVVAEKPEEISDLKPIEDLLTAEIRTFQPRRGDPYAYFRLDITRKGSEVLPVLEKDVLLVQDCSASVTEQRLYFCRQGLLDAVGLLGEGDRFNVIGFRDATESCFPTLSDTSEAAREQASTFIRGMTSHGDTDIYASTRELLNVPSTPGRPQIVLLITDGLPTAGVTDSARIIADFSRDNDGKRSVFSMGVSQWANAYLLDLLAYRNRGDAHIVSNGRWDIPIGIVKRMREVSRPVLTDVRLTFTDTERCMVYPQMTSNLYLDRPLVLYGRYNPDLPQVYLQAIGQAADVQCDMIFRFNLERAERGEKEIREAWARQYVFHLIGEHTRTHDVKLVKEIRRVSKDYKLETPYSGRL
ncbi:MAG: VWA domain-containing protein [Verrucomicrobia bacterium]|nr:VWA domain-containing protein [Verrucomicrobiota bacterium]